MSLLDLATVAIAVVVGLWGYQLGLFSAVCSIGGLLVGLYVGARLLPDILSSTRLTPGDARLIAVAALTVGSALGFSVGLAAGGRLHRFLPLGALRQADRSAGVGVGLLGVGIVLWLLIPSLAASPGWPARVTRQSVIARWVSRDLPDPPNTVEVLRRLFGGSTSPEVFAALQPGTNVGPPPSASPLTGALTASVSASTVKVEGQACNEIIEGSGFAVAANLVVTNAHVVAGEGKGDTQVLLPSGRQAGATVVLFDPERDLALLSVPGLGETPLSVGTGHAGETAAVFGHPNGEDRLSVQPAMINEEITAVGLDLYDRHTTSRDVFVLAASLAHGDSGAPLLSDSGQVVGVVFAIAADQSSTGYALTSAELRADLNAARTASPVSTGPCLSG